MTDDKADERDASGPSAPEPVTPSTEESGDVSRSKSKPKPGFIKRYLSFKYHPYDGASHKTRLSEYQPGWIVQKLDYFGDIRSAATSDVLPQTVCGALISVVTFLWIGALCASGVFRLYNNQTTVISFGEATINVDWICDGPAKCHWSNGYASTWWEDKAPYLDIPALNLTISHAIEFYEADHKTSLRRITYRDKNGIFFGGTSTNADVPVSLGAQGKVSVPLDSYPNGASPVNSENPPVVRRISDMLGIALSQAFPTDSLKYMYARWNMFADNEDFFEHDAYVFFRLDPKQLKSVKSCQLQLGLVNALEYSIFQPYLKMHDREMQKNDYLTSVKSTTKSWDPINYDARTGTYRRKYSPDTLFLLNSKISRERVGQLLDTTNIEGLSKVNTSKMLESEVDITRKNPPLAFVDWMFWISYVNNFMRTANTMLCDGKSGASFVTNKLRVKAPLKNSTVLKIVLQNSANASEFSESTFVMDPPFYIVVTGDMGREKMLVMDMDFTADTLTVVRGSVIGQLALEFNVTRPESYPSIPKNGKGGWICPVNKYMDGTTCDCMCGMTDPDCLLGTLPILNCNTDDGEVCSPLGRCTVPIYESGEVAVSTSCHELILNGEEFVSGFLGHDRDQVVWSAVGDGECMNGTRLLPSASKAGVKTVACRSQCSEYGTTCVGFSLHTDDLKCRLHFHNLEEAQAFKNENKAWATHQGDYSTTWAPFADVCVDINNTALETANAKTGNASLEKCKKACLRRSLPTAYCHALQWNSTLSEKCKLIFGNAPARGASPSVNPNATCYVRPEQATGINTSTGAATRAGWKCYARGASKSATELCKGCPWDDLYAGKSNRNEHNKWVCQYRATGNIMSADVIALDETIADASNAYGISDFTKGRILKVNLGAKSGFPLLTYSATDKTGRYTVELSNGQGNHELVTVIEAKTPTPGENAQTLAIIPLGASSGNEQQFRYYHFSTGSLLSALQPESGDMVVELDTDKKTFDQSGPFKVIVDSSEFIIRSASVMAVSNSTTSDGRKRKQRLDIASFPKGFGAQGLRSRLVRKVKANMATSASLYNYNSDTSNFEDTEPSGNCLSLYSGTSWASTCACSATAPADATCSDHVVQKGVGELDVIQVFFNIEFPDVPAVTLTNQEDPNWTSSVRDPFIQALEDTLWNGTPLTRAHDISVRLLTIMEGGPCEAVFNESSFKVQVHFSVPIVDTGRLRELLSRHPKFFNNTDPAGFMMNLRNRGIPWNEVEWASNSTAIEFLDLYFGQGTNYHSGNQPPPTTLGVLPTTKTGVATMLCLGGASWATTKFCDGLHDGLLVVEMVGFSDPKLHPVGSKNMKVLIRSSDPSITSKMEVRNITRAYQWRFPQINQETGDIDRSEEVGLWLCDPSQWLDGTCDCNCGRFDPDCAGANADPYEFAFRVRFDTTVSVRHNCPFGPDMPTLVLGATGACHIPCMDVVGESSTYVFCAHKRGRLSGASATLETLDANALIDASLLENGKLREHDRYLWEVIEIDSGLQTDREAGVIVESLMVSSDASAQYFNAYTPDYMAFTDDFSETNAAYLPDFVDPYFEDPGAVMWSSADAASAFMDPTFDASQASTGEYDPYAFVDPTTEDGADVYPDPDADGAYDGAVVGSDPGTDVGDGAYLDPGAELDSGAEADPYLGGNEDYTYVPPPRALFQDSHHTVFPRNLRAVVHDVVHVQPERLAHLTLTSKNPRKKSPSATAVFRALGGNVDHYYSRPHHTIGGAKRKGIADKPRRLNPDGDMEDLGSNPVDGPWMEFDPAISCDAFTGMCEDPLAGAAFIDAEYAAPTSDKMDDFYMEYVDSAPEQANSGEKLSSFAAEVINQLPEKMVISSSIQSMVDINLFRAPENSYYPKDRHKPNVKENYASTMAVDVDIAMFAVAKRVPIADLCPKHRITGEQLVNVFRNQGSMHQDYWAKWKLQPNIMAHLAGNQCQTAAFDSSACLSREEIQSMSKHKYRLYCTKNMHPVNTLTYVLTSPLNLKWELPKDRPSADTMAPEWSTDWDTEYYFTYDENTIKAEQDFMRSGGGNDFMNGVRTLWASSPYVRGRALCNSTGFTDCSMGLPANVPMLLPTISLAVDRERTWTVVQQVKAKFWPKKRADFDALMDRIDGYTLDIQGILRSLLSTEDGYIPLKPATNIFLSVSLSISPIYREDLLSQKTLQRWLIEVASARISEGSVDYSSKSKMNFRVRVDLVPKANRYLERYQYTLSDFMSDIGAWMGYMALAGSVLAFWISKMQPFGIVNPWECDEAQFGKQVESDEATAAKLTKKKAKLRFLKAASVTPVTPMDVNDCTDDAEEDRKLRQNSNDIETNKEDCRIEVDAP